jgi:hypothetical protein
MIKYLPLLLLVACGSDSDQSAQAPDQEPQQTSYVCAHKQQLQKQFCGWGCFTKTVEEYECISLSGSVCFAYLGTSDSFKKHYCDSGFDWSILEDL